MRTLLNLKLVLAIMLFCFSMGTYYGSVQPSANKIAIDLVWQGWYANAIDRDPKRALTLFEKAERIDPHYGWLYLCRADVLAEHYSKDGALKEYNKAIAFGGSTEVGLKAKITRDFVASINFDLRKDFNQQVNEAYRKFEQDNGMKLQR